MSRFGYLFSLACGLCAAGYVTLYRLDDYSESRLIELAPLWVAPAAFGLAGLFALRTGAKSPLVFSLLATLLAEVLLVAFILGVFPLL